MLEVEEMCGPGPCASAPTGIPLGRLVFVGG